jgi:hypothetical protein
MAAEPGTPFEWTWCFRAELYTLFKIDPHRGADVLLEVLGEEFDGVLGCDGFSAYHRSMRECGAVVQLCSVGRRSDDCGITFQPF